MRTRDVEADAEGLRTDLLPTVPAKTFQLGLLVDLHAPSHLYHPLLSSAPSVETGSELLGDLSCRDRRRGRRCPFHLRAVSVRMLLRQGDLPAKSTCQVHGWFFPCSLPGRCMTRCPAPVRGRRCSAQR